MTNRFLVMSLKFVKNEKTHFLVQFTHAETSVAGLYEKIARILKLKQMLTFSVVNRTELDCLLKTLVKWTINQEDTKSF